MTTFGIKIKICGITNLKDAQNAQDLGANAIGFIFYKKSPRYISPLKVAKIIKRINPFISCVGVFVDEKIENVIRIRKICSLTAVQLHGRESPGYCRLLKKCLPNIPLIKSFRIKDRDSLKDFHRYKVDAYLLDTFQGDMPGGTGKTFDWSIAKKAKKCRHPIIISGGLNSKNVLRAIKYLKPYAVDASSGLEKFPGKKDYRLLRQFIQKVKEVN